MNFQFKEPRRCMTGASHFTFPGPRVHVKLQSWKYFGTTEGLVVLFDPVLSPEEERQLFRQHGLLYVEHGNAARLDVFTPKILLTDFSDLI